MQLLIYDDDVYINPVKKAAVFMNLILNIELCMYVTKNCNDFIL